MVLKGGKYKFLNKMRSHGNKKKAVKFTDKTKMF